MNERTLLSSVCTLSMDVVFEKKGEEGGIWEGSGDEEKGIWVGGRKEWREKRYKSKLQ